MQDERKVFDIIPEQFEKWRPRYSQELFDFIADTVKLDSSKKCLEIGPGTGQASDFAVKTGCDYTAIELGENLTEFMQRKFGNYPNFKILNADFEKYEFKKSYYDLLYSAAAIQWIDQDIAYKKCFDMLKSGGYLAMFLTREDREYYNPELYAEIRKVYDTLFVSDMPYTRHFDYNRARYYGFSYEEKFEYYSVRTFNADDYVQYISTHSDHITLNAAYRDKFLQGIHDAVVKYGNIIRLRDTHVLYLCRK